MIGRCPCENFTHRPKHSRKYSRTGMLDLCTCAIRTPKLHAKHAHTIVILNGSFTDTKHLYLVSFICLFSIGRDIECSFLEFSSSTPGIVAFCKVSHVCHAVQNSEQMHCMHVSHHCFCLGPPLFFITLPLRFRVKLYEQSEQYETFPRTDLCNQISPCLLCLSVGRLYFIAASLRYKGRRIFSVCWDTGAESGSNLVPGCTGAFDFCT